MRLSATFPGTPLSSAEEPEDTAHLHLLVETALLGEVSDAISDTRVEVWLAKEGDRASRPE